MRYFGFVVTPLYLAGSVATFLAVLLYSGLVPALFAKLASRRAARLAAQLSLASCGVTGDNGGGGGGKGGDAGSGLAAAVNAADEAAVAAAAAAEAHTAMMLPGYPWSKSLLGGASPPSAQPPPQWRPSARSRRPVPPLSHT